MSHDIYAAGVFGFFAWSELFLALDLKQDFDALKRGGDERHGDGGEEARGADLADAVLRDSVLVGNRREVLDKGFADAVAPEGDHEHGGYADEGGGDAGIEASGQSFAGDGFACHVEGGFVDAAFGGLHAHFDEVEGVADDDSADAADAAGDEVAELRGCGCFGLLDFSFQVVFGGDFGLEV